jgi:hypothetical protein
MPTTDQTSRPLMKFGQPLGGIIQMAYTTPDIEQSMRELTAKLGIGPWYVAGPFVPPEGIYRGRPTDMRLTLAVAFNGHMMVEFIQQHDDQPSVYQEYIAERGYGFHHWAIATRDLDGEIERYRREGYEVAFSDRSPRGVRIAYMDMGRALPGMLEIIEVSDALEDVYLDMYETSRTWDGKDPFRRAGPVKAK